MFTKIMVPVDLNHRQALERSLEAAAELARHFKAQVVYVGVTAETPGPQGHTPAEYAANLDAFASAEVERRGHTAYSVAYASHDPAIELNKVLLEAATECQADLIVMASHVPSLADHLWGSHGAHLSRYAKVSVLLVR